MRKNNLVLTAVIIAAMSIMAGCANKDAQLVATVPAIEETTVAEEETTLPIIEEETTVAIMEEETALTVTEEETTAESVEETAMVIEVETTTVAEVETTTTAAEEETTTVVTVEQETTAAEPETTMKVEPETTIVAEVEPETTVIVETVAEPEQYADDTVVSVSGMKLHRLADEPQTEEVETVARYEGLTEEGYYDKVAEEFTRLLTEKRVEAGLSSVVIDEWAQKYADIRAEEIKVRFSHTRPNGEASWGCEVITQTGGGTRDSKGVASGALAEFMCSKPHWLDLMYEGYEYWGVAASSGGVVVVMWDYADEGCREFNINTYRQYLDPNIGEDIERMIAKYGE